MFKRLIYLVIVLSVSSCGHKEIPASLIGEWHSCKNSFKEAGAMKLVFDEKHMKVSYSTNSYSKPYRRLNDSIIEVRTNDLVEQYRFKFSGDSLSFRRWPLPEKPQKIIETLELMEFTRSK